MKFAYLIEPPFNYHDDNGAIKGCDIELATHVFREIGVHSVEFIEAEFAELLPGLQSKKWDVTTGLFATKQRRITAQFSRPIWALPDGLLIREADEKRIQSYRSIANDKSLRLAVIRNQFQVSNAESLEVSSKQILTFDTYEEAARAVESGTVDAYASVAKAHEGYLERYNKPNLRALTIMPEEIPPSFGCFGFSLESNDLRVAFDQVLQRFLCSKEHMVMTQKYGFTQADIQRLSHSSELGEN